MKILRVLHHQPCACYTNVNISAPLRRFTCLPKIVLFKASVQLRVQLKPFLFLLIETLIGKFHIIILLGGFFQASVQLKPFFSKCLVGTIFIFTNLNVDWRVSHNYLAIRVFFSLSPMPVESCRSLPKRASFHKKKAIGRHFRKSSLKQPV